MSIYHGDLPQHCSKLNKTLPSYVLLEFYFHTISRFRSHHWRTYLLSFEGRDSSSSLNTSFSLKLQTYYETNYNLHQITMSTPAEVKLCTYTEETTMWKTEEGARKNMAPILWWIYTLGEGGINKLLWFPSWTKSRHEQDLIHQLPVVNLALCSSPAPIGHVSLEQLIKLL